MTDSIATEGDSAGTVIGHCYRGVENAWLGPRGGFYAVEEWEHERWAKENHGCDTEALVKRGWVRIMYWAIESETVTQAQLDTAFDWARANDIGFQRGLTVLDAR